MCPSDEALAALPEGRLEAGEREAVERHAAGCPRCRRLLLLAGTAREPGRTSAWIWKAAAAVLLLAGGWAWLGRRDPSSVPTPAPSASWMSQGVDLVLEKGARISGDPAGRRLRVETGRLWMSAGGEEPVTLEAGGIRLTLKAGQVAVQAPEAPRDLLMREAGAAEGVPVAWVLEGTAWLDGRSLPAGSSVLENREIRTFPESEAQALRKARMAALLALPGTAVGSEVPSAYRWVNVLKARRESTEVGLVLGIPGPSGPSWYRWVVGLARGGSGSEEVLEAAWDGNRLTGRLNGVTVFSAGRRELDRMLLPVEPGGWQVSVWGGAASVESSRMVGNP